MRAILVPILVAAVAAGMGMWAGMTDGIGGRLRALGSDTPAGGAAVTAAPDTRSRVTALGRIEPRTEVVDVSGPAGARVLSLETEEGADVEEGAVLARLHGALERQAARDAATARLAEAVALRDAETAVGEAAIEEAQLRLSEVTRLKPLEIQAQEAEVRRLEVESGNARRSLERLERLRKMGQSTEQAVDDQSSQVDVIAESLAHARHTLTRIRAAAEIERSAAEAAIRAARANLLRARAAAGVSAREAEVALTEAELETTVVRAPVAGSVLKVLTRPGERVGAEPIVKLGDTAEMYVVAEVYETDARFVTPGQRARVESPALPGPVEGTVERVSRVVFKNDVLDIDPSARVDARVVEVRIRLDESATAARFNNLQVRVTIELAEAVAVSPAGTAVPAR